MLPEKFKAIIQKHSFHQNIHCLSSRRPAFNRPYFSRNWQKVPVAYAKPLIHPLLRDQTTFLCSSAHQAHLLAKSVNNLRDEAVLNKLIIEKKNSPHFKYINTEIGLQDKMDHNIFLVLKNKWYALFLYWEISSHSFFDCTWWTWYNDNRASTALLSVNLKDNRRSKKIQNFFGNNLELYETSAGVGIILHRSPLIFTLTGSFSVCSGNFC